MRALLLVLVLAGASLADVTRPAYLGLTEVRDGRFEVRTASTGYEAGIVTERFRPDVMLLDFKLPDINGNAVCRTIRANPNYEHIKIIVISGVADPDEVAELQMAGADDFIRKPFDINAVIARISDMVKVN